MKICIIGNNLTSLILAKNLLKKKIKVDIFLNKIDLKYFSTRTIGITDKNTKILESTFPKIKNLGYPIREIKIYKDKNAKEDILSFSDLNKNQFYTFKYDKLYEFIKKSFKKERNFNKFNLKKNIDLNILQKKYDLIVDTDLSNKLAKKKFSRKIKKNYLSKAFTVIIKHKNTPNKIARQIFTAYGPLAFLPLASNETSVVFSIKNQNFNIDKNYFKKLVENYNNFYDGLKFKEIKFFNINFSLMRNYHFKNILAFGDKLHKIHPLAGQGFNMNLRDIEDLLNIVDDRVKLGLPLDINLLKEFESLKKYKNFIFANSIDFVYEIFEFEKKVPDIISNRIFKIIKKSNIIPKYSSKIANEGLLF